MTEKENKRNEMQRENNASKWSHNRKIGWKTLLMMRTEKWKRKNSNNETRHRQILLLKARKAFACSESKFALSFAFSLHNLARMQTHKRNNEHTHTSRARLYISRVELFFFPFRLWFFDYRCEFPCYGTSICKWLGINITNGKWQRILPTTRNKRIGCSKTKRAENDRDG